MEAILKWCIVSFNYSYTTAAKHKIASMTMNLPGNPTSCEVASHAIRWHLWHYEQNQKKSILDHNILWLLQWYLKPNSKARQRFQLTHLWCRYIEMYLCNINWATYQHGRSWCEPEPGNAKRLTSIQVSTTAIWRPTFRERITVPTNRMNSVRNQFQPRKGVI